MSTKLTAYSVSEIYMLTEHLSGYFQEFRKDFQNWKEKDEGFVKKSLATMVASEWGRLIKTVMEIRADLLEIKDLDQKFTRVISAENPATIDTVDPWNLQSWDLTTDGYSEALAYCFEITDTKEIMIRLAFLEQKLVQTMNEFKAKEVKLASRLSAEDAALKREAKPLQDRADALEEGFERDALLKQISTILNRHTPEYATAKGRRESINKLLDTLKKRLTDVTNKYFKMRKDEIATIMECDKQFGGLENHGGILYSAMTKHDIRSMLHEMYDDDDYFISQAREKKISAR